MPPPAEGLASRLILGPALRTQPDRRLVMLVRDGYESAFEEIVRRYGRPLVRYAASIVGNRSEDVTQDAFSKALPALQRGDAEIELRPWLFRIVRNTALNDLRDSPPSPEVLAEAIAGGRNPAEELERREELADLMQRLQALPEPQRAAIVMRELEGLGHEEIAAALGLSGGAARQAIYRARQALRDGAGMLIPLPLLQAMLVGGGSGVAETAGAAGVSAAGVGGAAGAGVALKATAATVLVAGAVGAGVALKDNPRSNDAKAAPVHVAQRQPHAAAAPVIVARNVSGNDGRQESGNQDSRRGHGEPMHAADRSGRSPNPDKGGGGSSHQGEVDGGPTDGRSEGRGPSHSDSSEHGGHSEFSGDGSGHGEPIAGDGGVSHSGPGPGGGDIEESISSGSGSGGSGDSGVSGKGGGEPGSAGSDDLSRDSHSGDVLPE
jgi:RNA polymerase sigma factor (sigma-70 family)